MRRDIVRTRRGAAMAVQAAGAAVVVAGIGLLAGLAWAVLAAGVVLLVAGTLAEVG